MNSNQAVEQPSRKPGRIVYNQHFWVIIAIMTALIVFYNANHIDSSRWFPWLKEVFTTEFIHDLHRSLFLIPLLYAGAVFRLRGAIIAWLVFLAAVLPRALYFSPYPDSLARTLTFASPHKASISLDRSSTSSGVGPRNSFTIPSLLTTSEASTPAAESK